MAKFSIDFVIQSPAATIVTIIQSPGPLCDYSHQITIVMFSIESVVQSPHIDCFLRLFSLYHDRRVVYRLPPLTTATIIQSPGRLLTAGCACIRCSCAAGTCASP